MPLLEAALAGVTTSVTLGELWSLSSSPLCLIDTEWHVLAANPAFLSLTGQPATGRKLDDLVQAFPGWDRLHAAPQEHHRATGYEVVLVTQESVATFRVDTQVIPCQITDQYGAGVLLQFTPRQRSMTTSRWDAIDLSERPPGSAQLSLATTARILARRAAQGLAATLIVGYLSCPSTSAFSLDCLTLDTVSSMLLDQLRYALQPFVAGRLDASTLIAVTDEPASHQLIETLHDLRDATGDRFPSLTTWPFLTRLIFAVIPVTERCVVSEETLHTTIERTRHLVTCLDHPVAVFSPDEADPAPPPLTAVVEALLDRRFTFVAQPIAPLQPSQPPRVELLARLAVGDRRLSPAFFLPLVQELRLQPALLQASLEQASRLAATGAIVHVNAEPSALLELAAEGRLSSLSARTLRGRLVLEITDGHVGADVSRLSATLDALRQEGIEIALDDFGVGFQGCLPLTLLPLDLVKIDRALTRTLAHERDRIVIEAIVQTCRKLGLATVVEGVEDARLLPILTSWHVDYVQGFATGRPCPLPVGS